MKKPRIENLVTLPTSGIETYALFFARFSRVFLKLSKNRAQLKLVATNHNT
jgi:hypothetical protein